MIYWRSLTKLPWLNISYRLMELSYLIVIWELSERKIGISLSGLTHSKTLDITQEGQDLIRDEVLSEVD